MTKITRKRTKKTPEDLINEELDEIRYAWKYKGERFLFTPDELKGYTGFVYLITNKESGRKYIGQKMFSRAKTTQKNGKKIKSRVESTWKMYYGSNKELNEDVKILGRDFFDREILYLCENKTMMNYLETLEILRSGALLSEKFYNLWCSCKLTGKYVKLDKNPERCLYE